jgi:hypothetical protein
VIYTAMTGVLNAPNDDRFMVITEHDTDHPTEPDHRGDGQQHLCDLVFGRARRQRLAAAPFQADLYRRGAKAQHQGL